MSLATPLPELAKLRMFYARARLGLTIVTRVDSAERTRVRLRCRDVCRRPRFAAFSANLSTCILNSVDRIMSHQNMNKLVQYFY